MSRDILKCTENFRDFLFDNVYKHPSITGEMDKAKNILYELYRFLSKNMDIIYNKLNTASYIKDTDDRVAIVDFLALMTDTEAINLFFKYFIPKSFYM
jgi:dGTPase